MTFADKILKFYQALTPPKGLAKDIVVLNPYKDQQAWELTKKFYHQYYNDTNERVVLFGINPGRFGGGLTGAPFTDPVHLEAVCGIKNDLDKRAELSSTFIYEMIQACGGPKTFYSRYYISSISPLGYVYDDKNLNYYDIKGFKDLFLDYAKDLMVKQLDFPLNTSVAYSIGKGDNIKFLKDLNKKYGVFESIKPLPHPRWVMQYRLKRKQEFIQEYKDTLGF
ncbi:uracil-DNA glycosylase family protein [Marinoscillum pacificum]|uniref:uracil-DNA glycosylase family protein n=1 Tax=Marinoscillum pacificum TaxID=392723 RepID=UPI002156FCA5|nr:uracil-DNA glycosylase family protein [Marinoscillum pacificum]